MKDINNNFINTKNKPNQADYLEISQTLANFHATCFTNSKNRYSKKSMLFFLEKPLYHIFYNQISLAIIQVAGEEAELITLAVESKQRKKGIGCNLLKSIILHLESIDIKNLFLEVAVTNKIALKLYGKVGFTTCGLRKGYYGQGSNKKDDAIIMTYPLVTEITKSLKSDKKKLQNLYPSG